MSVSYYRNTQTFLELCKIILNCYRLFCFDFWEEHADNKDKSTEPSYMIYDVFCSPKAHSVLSLLFSNIAWSFPKYFKTYSLYACLNKFTKKFMFLSKESVQITDLLLPIWLNSKQNYVSNENDNKYPVGSETWNRK